MTTNIARKRVRRQQGRPDVTKAVGKEALLSAARYSLRAKPPGEVTLQEIAKHAGDPALIRYYFGSLDDLMTAVAVEISRELRYQMIAIKEIPGTPRERMKLRIKAFLRVFQDNPHYHRLMVDFLFTRNSSENKGAVDRIHQSIEELEALMKEDLASTRAKPLDARLAHVGMAALCEFLFSAKPIFETIFGEEVDTPRFLEKYTDFVADLVLGERTSAG
jgi:AcrR family transcriptional regulator